MKKGKAARQAMHHFETLKEATNVGSLDEDREGSDQGRGGELRDQPDLG